jgi:PPOX class probable F420-dependent enzyme
MWFDEKTEKGAHLAERLRKEQVVWLTTVRADGTPMPTPVWFLWDGDTILIYTLHDSLKLRNLAQNPRATLNFNSDESGGEVVVLTGKITIDPADVPPQRNAKYIEKYRQGLSDIDLTPENFAKNYSTPLRFHPERVRI